MQKFPALSALLDQLQNQQTEGIKTRDALWNKYDRTGKWPPSWVTDQITTDPTPDPADYRCYDRIREATRRLEKALTYNNASAMKPDVRKALEDLRALLER